MIRRFPLFAVVLAGLCLLGYLTVDTTGLNVRLLVVVFWLAFICSLVALLLVRRKRLLPLAACLGAWALLWPCGESVLTWSAWWLHGFAG